MFDIGTGPDASAVGKRREASGSGPRAPGPGSPAGRLSQQTAFPRLPVRGEPAMPAFLARRPPGNRGEPVDVERRDDAPVVFLRRGRRYTVGAVLAHWWETAAWWESAELAGPASGSSVADDERELWRVEASARGGPDVVVELCFSWVTGRWAITAVHD